MKPKAKNTPTVYPPPSGGGFVLKDRADFESSEVSMIRTQIYLTRKEHEFLQSEAERQGQPMSAFLRQIIDDRMNVPESAWQLNPMLEPTPEVEGWAGDEDAALNHDHYVYGGERKYEKAGQKWVLQPPAGDE
jgi:hypothetical protein